MSSSSRRIHTKEMISCIILIVVGCLTTFSYSTAVSASNRSISSADGAIAAAIHRNSERAKNFNGNGILRDDDTAQQQQQQSIGNFAIAVPASTLKSHKKHINGDGSSHADGEFNVNGPNDNGAHSPHNANYFNRYDEGDTNDDNNYSSNDDNGNVDHDDDDGESSDFISIEVDDQLSLKDQMRLFTEQMTKRFHRELNAAVRKTTKDLYKADFQSQLEQLR